MGWALWSPNGGVGSNPTSDTTHYFFSFVYPLKNLPYFFVSQFMLYFDFLFREMKWLSECQTIHGGAGTLHCPIKFLIGSMTSVRLLAKKNKDFLF